MRKLFITSILIILVIFCVTIFSKSIFSSKNTITLLNQSLNTINEINIMIEDSTYKIKNLSPNKIEKIHFNVSRDTGAKMTITSSNNTYEHEFGYFTNGISTSLKVEIITPSQIEVINN